MTLPKNEIVKNLGGRLLPCPFCGSRMQIKKVYFQGFPAGVYNVECRKCPLEIAQDYKLLANAIKACNRRPEDGDGIYPPTVRDLKYERPCRHPLHCTLPGDNCWGLPSVEKEGYGHCKKCEFYKPKGA